MSLVIKDEATPPFHGWTYPHVVPDKLIRSFNYNLFYPLIVETYTSNGKTPPTQEEVVRYICEKQYVECFENREPFVNLFTRGLPPPPPAGCCGRRAPLPQP